MLRTQTKSIREKIELLKIPQKTQKINHSRVRFPQSAECSRSSSLRAPSDGRKSQRKGANDEENEFGKMQQNQMKLIKLGKGHTRLLKHTRLNCSLEGNHEENVGKRVPQPLRGGPRPNYLTRADCEAVISNQNYTTKHPKNSPYSCLSSVRSQLKKLNQSIGGGRYRGNSPIASISQIRRSEIKPKIDSPYSRIPHKVNISGVVKDLLFSKLRNKGKNLKKESQKSTIKKNVRSSSGENSRTDFAQKFPKEKISSSERRDNSVIKVSIHQKVNNICYAPVYIQKEENSKSGFPSKKDPHLAKDIEMLRKTKFKSSTNSPRLVVEPKIILVDNLSQERERIVRFNRKWITL